MTVQLEWVLGAMTIIIGTLFTLSLQNRARLNRHEIQLAKLDGINDKMDQLARDFAHALEKHEIKEDRQFNDMNRGISSQFTELHRQVSKLVINVALLKKKSDVEGLDG